MQSSNSDFIRTSVSVYRLYTLWHFSDQKRANCRRWWFVKEILSVLIDFLSRNHWSFFYLQMSSNARLYLEYEVEINDDR